MPYKTSHLFFAFLVLFLPCFANVPAANSYSFAPFYPDDEKSPCLVLKISQDHKKLTSCGYIDSSSLAKAQSLPSAFSQATNETFGSSKTLQHYLASSTTSKYLHNPFYNHILYFIPSKNPLRNAKKKHFHTPYQTTSCYVISNAYVGVSLKTLQIVFLQDSPSIGPYELDPLLVSNLKLARRKGAFFWIKTSLSN